MPRTKKPANGSSDSPKPARASKKSNGAADDLNNPDAVARRAYEIYQRRGGNDGADLDDWLEAERQLQTRTERRHRSCAGEAAAEAEGFRKNRL